jgi:hypothetical protein
LVVADDGCPAGLPADDRRIQSNGFEHDGCLIPALEVGEGVQGERIVSGGPKFSSCTYSTARDA